MLFLGSGVQEVDMLRFPPHDRITVQNMAFCSAGWRQKLHYIRFSLWALFWALRWRPEWLYASDFLSCPVALLLSFLPGVRVIYHEHDSPAKARGNIFQRMSMVARRILAHRAEICVLPNQQRAERFAGEMSNGANVLCVWNCPSLEELSAPRPAHGGDLYVLYHGSIVPSRLPPTVLQALEMLPDTVKLRIVGYETIGHRSYVRELQERATRLGVDKRVEFVGTVTERNHLLEWCRKCDVGLAFMPQNSEDVNEQAMTGASNKPFDYLSCGLALLVSDLPDWRQMYVDPGYGLACNSADPESIAAALRWFLEHPDERRKMGEQGRQRIANEWHYERQFAPVMEILSNRA